MSVYPFEVTPEAIARAFSVYMVVAVGDRPKSLYVGETGDNRAGCNPIISRCGNHFSYFEVHSQIRNKIEDHEKYSYRYFFVHFDRYRADGDNQEAIDRINEMTNSGLEPDLRLLRLSLAGKFSYHSTVPFDMYQVDYRPGVV